MAADKKYWFISYWNKSYGNSRNTLIDYSPLEWQLDNLPEITLLFFHEISKEEFLKYNNKF